MKLATNNSPLLLDTCAVIWLAGDKKKLNAEAKEAIEAAERAETPVYLSPISLWEVGSLIARERVDFTVETWNAKFRQHPGVRLANMPGDLLFRSHFLPDTPPRDPADRIIIQTASEYGYRIVTRDREILEYAERKEIARLVC